MNTLSDCRLAITRTYRLGDLLDFRNDMVHPHDKPVGSATFVGLEHIEQNTGVRLGAVDVELTADEIKALETPYRPHPVGPML